MTPSITHSRKLIPLAAALVTGGSAAVAGQFDCPPDIDSSGDVTIQDLSQLISVFGMPNALTDLDNSGVTDQPDAGILLAVDGLCDNPHGPGPVTLVAARLDNSDVRTGDDGANPEFDGGVTHFSFEISADATGGANGWTSASGHFRTTAAYPFFQHNFGDDAPPSPALIGAFPAAAYDSYFGGPTSGSLFAINTSASDTDITAETWGAFMSFADTIGQSVPVTRFTIVVPEMPNDPTIRPLGDNPSPTQIDTIDITWTTGLGEGTLQSTTFELLMNPLVADVNGDCVVDTADLGLLIGEFGGDNPFADVNNDGVIDTADLGLLIGEFGGVCP